MTVTPSWQIDRQTSTSPGTYGVVEFEEGQPYEHVGVLVEDTRLQAIADAYIDASKVIIRGMFPTLADAIEAAITVEENNDD